MSHETNRTAADVSDSTNHTVADVSHRAIWIQAITSQHKHLIQASAVYVALQAGCSARRHEATASEKIQPCSKGKEEEKAKLFTERNRAVRECQRSGCSVAIVNAALWFHNTEDTQCPPTEQRYCGSLCLHCCLKANSRG